MISLISLTLFLLLSSLFNLFYLVFTVINFANLHFWIIKTSVPPPVPRPPRNIFWLWIGAGTGRLHTCRSTPGMMYYIVNYDVFAVIFYLTRRCRSPEENIPGRFDNKIPVKTACFKYSIATAISEEKNKFYEKEASFNTTSITISYPVNVT